MTTTDRRQRADLPDQPVQSDQRVQPDQPSQPVQLDQLGQPDQSDHPVQPVQPTARLIVPHDWTAIADLEEHTYTPLGLSEGGPALQSRAQISPGTCFVLDHDGVVVGYVVALPYPRFQFPELSRAEVDRQPREGRPANLHLHDLVVGEEFRGRGWAGQLASHLTAVARSLRFETISLIAVGGSDRWWRTRGFQAHPEVSPPAGYGPGAVVMSRSI
jgi:GNAT superfamily N-acetyltransferase